MSILLIIAESDLALRHFYEGHAPILFPLERSPERASTRGWNHEKIGVRGRGYRGGVYRVCPRRFSVRGASPSRAIPRGRHDLTLRRFTRARVTIKRPSGTSTPLSPPRPRLLNRQHVLDPIGVVAEMTPATITEQNFPAVHLSCIFGAAHFFYAWVFFVISTSSRCSALRLKIIRGYACGLSVFYLANLKYPAAGRAHDSMWEMPLPVLYSLSAAALFGSCGFENVFARRSQRNRKKPSAGEPTPRASTRSGGKAKRK